METSSEMRACASKENLPFLTKSGQNLRYLETKLSFFARISKDENTLQHRDARALSKLTGHFFRVWKEGVGLEIKNVCTLIESRRRRNHKMPACW